MSRTIALVAILVLLSPVAAASGPTANLKPSLPHVDLSPVANAGAAARDDITGGARATGAAFAAAAAAIGTALVAMGAAAATAAAALGALVASLFARGVDYVVAHPQQSAIAGGSVVGLAGLALLLKRFGGLLFLPLYTRLAPSQMLDNKARSDVYEHVRANPGVHPSAIAEALGLGWGTVVYHLSKLESSKLVAPRVAHNKKCYFAVGSDLDARGRDAVAAMAHDKAKLIVQVVHEAPGISQKQLAERVGMSQALASWHVKRLVESGVLHTERAGRSHALRVAEHVPVATAA